MKPEHGRRPRTLESFTAQGHAPAGGSPASLRTLASAVAHEVNNPLAGVLASQGFALEALLDLRGEILREGDGREDRLRRIDAIAEALRDAQECGQRIAGVVRELSVVDRKAREAVDGGEAGEPGG